MLAQALVEDRSDEWLEEQDLYLVSETPQYDLVATNSSNIAIYRPDVFYDSDLRRYFVIAEYRWDSMVGEDLYNYFDSSSSCDVDTPCNVGGKDGFALRFSRNLVNRQADVNFCGRSDITRDWANFAGCASPPPDANSSAGASFLQQDKVYKTVVKPDYNVYNGQIIIVVDPIACNSTVQMFSRYGHTWSSTGISAIEVGTAAINIVFTKTEDRWSVASQSGTWTRSC
ncbi:hypothetical protein SAMN05192576_0208 [Nocardioides szechwanensis]|uniref:Uncharacterized protein n=1 Tax=Nocardioides szechwanensis TaxID=1005944 RepID=A0A1H0LD62_9ACTN|nr:hypothetical protein SAMN05192576_0208 [Nocardioides szechwanensis]